MKGLTKFDDGTKADALPWLSLNTNHVAFHYKRVTLLYMQSVLLIAEYMIYVESIFICIYKKGKLMHYDERKINAFIFITKTYWFDTQDIATKRKLY